MVNYFPLEDLPIAESKQRKKRHQSDPYSEVTQNESVADLEKPLESETSKQKGNRLQ